MRQNSEEEEDDSQAGGRALDRLRQFEMERGYEDTDAVPTPRQEDDAEEPAETTGNSTQGGSEHESENISETRVKTENCGEPKSSAELEESHERSAGAGSRGRAHSRRPR